MAGDKRRVPTAERKQECAELADALGWKEKDVFFHFQQLAWHIEFDRKWPRECAEWLAMRHVTAVFDKRGQEPS